MAATPSRGALGALIRRRREELGRTQQDLAEQLKLDATPAISRWEKGEVCNYLSSARCRLPVVEAVVAPLGRLQGERGGRAKIVTPRSTQPACNRA